MFLEHLGTISGRIEGAIALSLVDRDGMPVESVSASPEFTVVAERMTFLVSAVANGYYLLLALAPTGSVGRARFELRRASLVLEEELS